MRRVSAWESLENWKFEALRMEKRDFNEKS